MLRSDDDAEPIDVVHTHVQPSDSFLVPGSSENTFHLTQHFYYAVFVHPFTPCCDHLPALQILFRRRVHALRRAALVLCATRPPVPTLSSMSKKRLEQVCLAYELPRQRQKTNGDGLLNLLLFAPCAFVSCAASGLSV